MTINPSSSALLSHSLESCSDNLKRQKNLGFQKKTQKSHGTRPIQDAEKLQRRSSRRLQESSFKV